MSQRSADNSALSKIPADSALSPADVALGFELVKSKTCLGCHQIDTKRVGPAFEQIAQRHGDTKGAVDYLAGAIRQGGRGRWGAVPMPAQPHVTELESQQIAQWILSLKH
jgi:cytochrome c